MNQYFLPQTVLEAWLLVLSISCLFGLIWYFVGLGIWKAWDRGRRWLFILPEVVGGWATVKRIRAKTPNWEIKVGDEGHRYELQGDAAYPSNMGPMHIMTWEGVSLVAPTKDEPGIEAKTGIDIKKDAKRFKRMRIWDALANWQAVRENDQQDLYTSNKEKDHWIVKLAPIAFVLLLLAMGAICFLAWGILKAQRGGA